MMMMMMLLFEHFIGQGALSPLVPLPNLKPEVGHVLRIVLKL
jgi:hypothetical protein